jgi:hypothetical protein
MIELEYDGIVVSIPKKKGKRIKKGQLFTYDLKPIDFY